jgi:uncharacterized membrane protein YfcA
MLSLPIVTAFAAAVVSTSFISGIFGMAGGMILLGILLTMLPLATAMVLHGVTQLASNGWRAWLWRAHIKWPIVGYYAAGAIVVAGLAFAAGQLAPSKATAFIALGLMPFIGLLLPTRFAPNISRPGHGFGFGAICTALQLVAGVAGPVFDVCFVRSELDRREMIATKAAVQALGHVVKIAYFGQLLAGGGAEISPAVVILAIALAMVGTQLSRCVLDIINDVQFRNWTRGLIAVVAAIYLVQGLCLLFLDSHAASAAIAFVQRSQ